MLHSPCSVLLSSPFLFAYLLLPFLSSPVSFSRFVNLSAYFFIFFSLFYPSVFPSTSSLPSSPFPILSRIVFSLHQSLCLLLYLLLPFLSFCLSINLILTFFSLFYPVPYRFLASSTSLLTSLSSSPFSILLSLHQPHPYLLLPFLSSPVSFSRFVNLSAYFFIFFSLFYPSVSPSTSSLPSSPFPILSRIVFSLRQPLCLLLYLLLPFLSSSLYPSVSPSTSLLVSLLSYPFPILAHLLVSLLLYLLLPFLSSSISFFPSINLSAHFLTFYTVLSLRQSLCLLLYLLLPFLSSSLYPSVSPSTSLLVSLPSPPFSILASPCLSPSISLPTSLSSPPFPNLSHTVLSLHQPICLLLYLLLPFLSSSISFSPSINLSALFYPLPYCSLASSTSLLTSLSSSPFPILFSISFCLYINFPACFHTFSSLFYPRPSPCLSPSTCLLTSLSSSPFPLLFHILLSFPQPLCPFPYFLLPFLTSPILFSRFINLSAYFFIFFSLSYHLLYIILSLHQPPCLFPYFLLPFLSSPISLSLSFNLSAHFFIFFSLSSLILFSFHQPVCLRSLPFPPFPIFLPTIYPTLPFLSFPMNINRPPDLLITSFLSPSSFLSPYLPHRLPSYSLSPPSLSPSSPTSLPFSLSLSLPPFYELSSLLSFPSLFASSLPLPLLPSLSPSLPSLPLLFYELSSPPSLPLPSLLPSMHFPSLLSFPFLLSSLLPLPSLPLALSFPTS
ncbi:hypothetical protein C7M84_005671 [Penaeus vannamei]|uniref:Uncharacterized protein n=1 Tax=Penaeus vannamei TaxID=6689 RepID=A0A423TH46_PENVA|nr:hypothetical protein C7M84_005671 [Penaeus vannamei]